MHRALIIRAGVGSACPRRCAVSSELRGFVAGDGRCPPTQDGSSWHGDWNGVESAPSADTKP
jgi:hypothetical protein